MPATPRFRLFSSAVGAFVALVLFASMPTGGLAMAGPDLRLAHGGATEYVIVKPAAPTDVDGYAIKTLAAFLGQKTGADFSVVPPGAIPAGRKRIFVGISAPALTALGENPLAALKEQEFAVRSVQEDIYLYGDGVHGNYYAVMDFMETLLGRRWFNYREKPAFERSPDLIVNPFDRKIAFSFAWRMPTHPSEFAYQSGFNMSFTELNTVRREKDGQDYFPPGVISAKRLPAFPHTTFDYVPPSPARDQAKYEWVKNKNYFQTNPEFFGMARNGHRYPTHLCFSNPALRAELTKNILEHIRRVGEKDLILMMAQEDANDTLCLCPECQKYDKLYQGRGGSMYDYIIELGNQVKQQYPLARILIMPYKTTKKPVVPPDGKRFPDNLIAIFPDNQDRICDREWSYPGNDQNYRYIMEWKKLIPHIWVYYYSVMYCAGSLMPYDITDLFVSDLRMMKQAGVEGIFCDGGTTIYSGNTFIDLQEYVYGKLLKNIDADVPTMVREYTDSVYGAAAPLTRQYLNDLQEARKTAKIPLGDYTHTVVDFEREFAYLSVDRLRRWQGMFDEMEKLTAGDAHALGNVKLLRRTLEFATLARWYDLAKAYPDYFTDWKVHKARLGNMSWWEKPYLADVETILQAGGQMKPLPVQFKDVPTSRLCRLLPVNTCNSDRAKARLDPDAAYGYATTVDVPDLPFEFGFYPWQDPNDTAQRVTIEKDRITPDVYALHKIGPFTITPKAIIWFSSKSWGTQAGIGERLYDPESNNRWEAYVSLKFSGPPVGGKGKDYEVLCDQIILVKAE